MESELIDILGDHQWLTLGKMSTGMTHLLARDGSFFSKAGNNIEASHYNEEMQVLSVVMNRQSLYGYGSLERVRLGHIFLRTIPAHHNAANLSK